MNGSSVPFLAEVPSCSFTVGRLSLGEFFHRIVRISGCGIVLDVSHVLSYALSTGRRPADVLDSLPLDAVVEVHVAGGRINKSYPFRYIDSHSDPVMDDVLDLLGHAVERCAGLRAVTYEIGMQLTAQMLAHDFERIEVVLAQLGFEPRLIGPGKAELRT